MGRIELQKEIVRQRRKERRVNPTTAKHPIYVSAKAILKLAKADLKLAKADSFSSIKK
jgi:hypothetical protein